MDVAAITIGIVLALMWCAGLLRLYYLLRQPWWGIWAASIGLWISRQLVLLAAWEWDWWLKEWIGTTAETIIAFFVVYGMLIWGSALAIARVQIRSKQIEKMESPSQGEESK